MASMKEQSIADILIDKTNKTWIYYDHQLL